MTRTAPFCSRFWRRGVFLLCGGVASLAGCGPSAEILLHQPQLPGRQRELSLTSNKVVWAAGQDAERLLAEFPLPGAATGEPTYVLYLRLPVGVKKPTVAAREPPTVCGFFIQTRGQYAGRAPIVGGSVNVADTSTARHAMRRLEVDLRCEDGTRITGRLAARRDDYHMEHFETQRRPSDVEALVSPTTAPGAGG